MHKTIDKRFRYDNIFALFHHSSHDNTKNFQHKVKIVNNMANIQNNYLPNQKV